MVCFTPMMGYQGMEVNPATGRRKPTFSGTKAFSGELIPFACGFCIGCRLDRAESWGIRGSHEAHMHEYYGDQVGSAFLTLTFRDECLPISNSLRVTEMQSFMRKLRRAIGKSVKVRFFACGEYGERKGRAHYHVALFGFRFPDRKLYKVTDGGHRLYTSELLDSLWAQGQCWIGDVSYKSAFYVAGYVAKKVGGDKRKEFYHRRSPVDGLFYDVEPEFSTQSLKPGLGFDWFKKYSSDVFPSDQVIIDGHSRKPPRYYEKIHGDEAMRSVKLKRMRDMRRNAANYTRDRLAVRELCLSRRLLGNERGFM